jgi:hypothetical protein
MTTGSGIQLETNAASLIRANRSNTAYGPLTHLATAESWATVTSYLVLWAPVLIGTNVWLGRRGPAG